MLDPALVTAGASDASTAPFLDPTEDLSPVHQSLVDQIAKQKGGKQAKNDRIEQYVQLASEGQDTSSILKTSFEGQMARDKAALTPQPQAGEFDHVGGTMDYGPPALPTPTEQMSGSLGVVKPLSTSGGPIGVQTPSAPAGGPLSAPQQGQQNGQGRPGAQHVPVPEVDEGAYQQASKNFYALMNARPTLHGFPDLEQPGIKELGLALLFAAIDRRHSGDILAAPYLFQQQKRNQAIQRIVQQYGLDENAWKTSATLAKDALDHTFSDLGKQKQERNDAVQFNAGEDNKLTKAYETLDQKTESDRVKSEAAKDRLVTLLKGRSDAEHDKIMGRRKALLEIYPEDKYPGKADEMTAAEFAEKAAKTAGIVLDNTFKQKTMTDRIAEVHQKLVNSRFQGMYIQARTKYTTEMTKYIPQTEALKWATLNALIDFRNATLGMQGLKIEEGTGKDVDSAIEKGYNAAVEQVQSIQDYLNAGVDKNGEKLTPEGVKQYEALLDVAKKSAERAEKALIDAEKDSQARKGRLGEKVKGVIQNFGKGKRPPPMPWTPVDPTGPGFDRTKVGWNANPYDDIA